jgi:hypothetical protein
MPPLGPTALLDGQPPAPPLFTLFGAATSPDDVADDRWIGSFAAETYPCRAGGVYDPSCGGSALVRPSAAAPAGTPVVQPFVAQLVVACEDWAVGSYDRLRQRALAAFAAYESWFVEREFATGAAIPANPHLSMTSATTLNAAAATSVVNGIALLEQAIANQGGRGMIHVPAHIGYQLALSVGCSRDGSRLVTPLGTIVVPGQGYPGNAPDGAAPADAGKGWCYATGLAQARRAPNPTVLPDSIGEALDRTTGQVTLIVERPYAVTWDRCVHAAVLIDRCKTTC